MTPPDIEAIRAWIEEQRGDEYCRDVVQAIEYLDALLAEVERLRDILRDIHGDQCLSFSNDEKLHEMFPDLAADCD